MGVVFGKGGNAWVAGRQRYTSAQSVLSTNLHAAIPDIAAHIRDRVDDGPGGIDHIVTGNLNDSLHGENADSVYIEIETDDGFTVVIGTLDPAAVFQARRFPEEGPVVSADPDEVRNIIDDHFLVDLREGV